MLLNRHRHMGPDERSMLAASRLGVVMGVAPRRVLAAVPSQRRPRAAATPPPPARSADATFAAAVADLLKPQPADPWAEAMKGLTTKRP